MAEAYIYDAVRTPRGKGKSSGSLHEITALQLATQALKAIKDRNSLDTSKVDDVILGCVSPVGEQGSDIARTAVMNAEYAQTTAGVQVDRFCASGLEACNIAAAKVMTGEADMAIGGGVEAMSRVPMGSNGGAWATNPEIAMKSYFVPQGIAADIIAEWRDGLTSIVEAAVADEAARTHADLEGQGLSARGLAEILLDGLEGMRMRGLCGKPAIEGAGRLVRILEISMAAAQPGRG